MNSSFGNISRRDQTNENANTQSEAPGGQDPGNNKAPAEETKNTGPDFFEVPEVLFKYSSTFFKKSTIKEKKIQKIFGKANKEKAAIRTERIMNNNPLNSTKQIKDYNDEEMGSVELQLKKMKSLTSNRSGNYGGNSLNRSMKRTDVRDNEEFKLKIDAPNSPKKRLSKHKHHRSYSLANLKSMNDIHSHEHDHHHHDHSHKKSSDGNLPKPTEPKDTGDDTTSEENLCGVCFAQPADSVYMPCGHGGICYDCAIDIWKTSDECYLCRKVMIYLMSPFFSWFFLVTFLDNSSNSSSGLGEYRGRLSERYCFNRALRRKSGGHRR